MLSDINFTLTAEAVSTIKNLAWPAVALICFFSVRKPLVDLIKRLTKVNIAGNSIEANQPQAIQNTGKELTISNVDKELSYFSQEAVTQFDSYVKNESKFMELATDADKIDRLLKYSTIIYIKSTFESIYSVIFGSQIQLLQRLNSFPEETYESLERFYKSGFPDKDYSYDNYLLFLYKYNLIIDNNGKIHITIMGVDFLKFIVANNKSIEKPN